jgi:hypothetical protein
VERVLTLDKAYPLHLLGADAEEVPSGGRARRVAAEEEEFQQTIVEKATAHGRSHEQLEHEAEGWDERDLQGDIERRDVEEYLKLSEKGLKLNKFLVILGPLLIGFVAVATALTGHFKVLPGAIVDVFLKTL